VDLGQSAKWTADVLKDEGVFEDICRPALGMIPRMDDIGLANDNGLAHMAGSRRRGGTSAPYNGQHKYEFW